MCPGACVRLAPGLHRTAPSAAQGRTRHMGLLSDRELASLLPAETHAFAGPVPTQSVSSDEFTPVPHTSAQRRVETRVKELGATLARRRGMTRRRFLATASGMAAAFRAMNEVYGLLYDVSAAEAQTPQMAKERADGLAKPVPQDWVLTNEMKAEARARVNREAGSRRLLSHAIFTPGYPGWMEQVDHAIRDL